MPKEGWGVFEIDDGCVHVAPIHGRQHVMSMGCWCLPELDDGVVMHASPADAGVIVVVSEEEIR